MRGKDRTGERDFAWPLMYLEPGRGELLDVLLQRINVQTAKQNFCAFRLNQNFATAWRSVHTFQCFVAVDSDRDFIAVTQYFHSIPFTARLLNLVRAAKTFFIPPWIASRPIKSSDLWTLGHAIHSEISATDYQNISRATFDDLSFNRFRPDLIFPAAMNENPAVARIRFPRWPCFLTPFELSDELVIGEIRLFGREIAVIFAADMQDAIRKCKDIMRVFIH